MQEKDYQNFDYIDIIVKKENRQEIIDAYSTFLWEKTQESEDKRYNDVVNLSFRRNIKVKNKDRLTYLQVSYETALNKRANIKFNKHSKSKIAICNVAFCSLASLFGVGVFIYFYKSILSIILASLFATLIFFIAFICMKKIKKKIAKENQDFIDKTKMIDEEIKEILSSVNNLAKKEQENLDCDRGEV